MSSFVRVCADFSNNLRNIGRIPWSSSNNNNNSNSGVPPNSTASSATSPTCGSPSPGVSLINNNNNNNNNNHYNNIGSNASSPPCNSETRRAPGPGTRAVSPALIVGPEEGIVSATDDSQQQLRMASRLAPVRSPTRAASYTVADIKQRLFTQGLKLELSPRQRRKRSTRFREYIRRRVPQPHESPQELWDDAVFVRHLFEYVRPREYGTLARVCRLWHSVLIDGHFWANQTRLLIDLRRARTVAVVTPELVANAGACLANRGLQSIELRHARDQEISAIEAGLTKCADRIQHLRVAISTLSDQSLLRLVRLLGHVTRLELYCCNDLTDAGLQACLIETRRLHVLSVVDCVHISDRTIGAIAATLPWLGELTIQAYHVTDTALTLFSAEQSVRLERVRLNFCMELTNFGVRNLVLTLRGIRELSLAGCSKISDDAVDILCENLKQLTALDLSWCGLVTDGALECISVDLRELRELKLDRCTAITDFGINYLNNLSNLRTLCLRFCISLSDTSLIHILNIISLRALSLAGCRRFTENGLCALVRHGRFRVLELSHCPAFTEAVRQFMAQDMPHCIILT